MVSLNNLNLSFKFSGLWLLCIGFYILIFSYIIKDNIAKIILLSETVVLAIASYFYSIFIKNINEHKYYKNSETSIRYIDWMLTTPLLLFSFTLFLSYFNNFHKKNKNILNINKYVVVIILNFIMLLFGYLGEIGKLSKNIALIISFIFFTLLILFIWYNFIFKEASIVKYIIFIIFIIIWAFYGVAYTFDVNLKNYTYNILDTFSKGFFGFLLLKFYLYKQFFT